MKLGLFLNSTLVQQLSLLTQTALVGFGREKIVKNSFISVVLGVILIVLIFVCCGCSQPGETDAQGNQRHLRNLRINQQELMQDVDRTLLFDEPSKLTDKRAP